jgi:PIN domain nuclease of toxin-antitoxin system
VKALLDTHVFLWWVMYDQRLTPFVRDFVADEKNELFLKILKSFKGDVYEMEFDFYAVINSVACIQR